MISERVSSNAEDLRIQVSTKTTGAEFTPRPLVAGLASARRA